MATSLTDAIVQLEDALNTLNITPTGRRLVLSSEDWVLVNKALADETFGVSFLHEPPELGSKNAMMVNTIAIAIE